MNAGTGKVEINKDWYDYVVSKVEEFKTTGFMTGGESAHLMVSELKVIDSAIARGKAVLV
jgi:hypothetical protein